MKQINQIYLYDGSFYGLLNCYYTALALDQLPLNIVCQNNTFFPIKNISSDPKIAKSMINGIKKRVCNEAYMDLRVLYLCNCHNKEIVGLKFLAQAFKHGASVLNMLSNADVAPFVKMVRLVDKESNRFIQFLRFSQHEESLIAVIEPEHCVLPIIAPHFTNRFGVLDFLIYDKTHGLALIYQNGSTSIVSLESFLEPNYNEDEQKYRKLWKDFYNSIEIKQRENLKLRNNFLPKKFQKNMTEFI